jgi:ubiquinone/menaquinone biosynthesis C-methylase UbiE
LNGLLYDALGASAERRHFAALRAGVLAPLRGRIIDVGCGTGLNFPHYASAAYVTALEPDSGMLRRAERRRAQSHATIELHLASDAMLDSFPAASADAVVFTLGLCTIADPMLALRRAERVLNANGRIVVLEHVRGRGVTARLQDAVAPLWARLFGGCRLNQDTRGLLERAELDVRGIADHHIGAFSPVRDLIAGTATPVARGAARDILN